MENNNSYKLVVQNIISHFSSPKALQLQKRYLYHDLYSICKTKIHEIIFRIKILSNTLTTSFHFRIIWGCLKTTYSRLWSFNFHRNVKKRYGFKDLISWTRTSMSSCSSASIKKLLGNHSKYSVMENTHKTSSLVYGRCAPSFLW